MFLLERTNKNNKKYLKVSLHKGNATILSTMFNTSMQ